MKRIILAKTCQRYRDRREACEATWVGKLRAEGIPVYFVEGGHQRTRQNGDVIELSTPDDYDSNSWKVRDAIRFLLLLPFDQLFICDDDTFVHWRRWLDFDPSGQFYTGLRTVDIPWIHGGAGWFMCREACELFVDGVKKRCSWDDRLASEIISGKGWALYNRPDLFAQWNERVGADNALITCHNVEPAEMHELFKATYDLPPVHDLLQRA